MRKILSFKKLKYFLLTFQILFILFLLFDSQFSSAQVCLPLQGYLAWSGLWEAGRIPMASSSENVLTASPFYVYQGKVGLNTTNPVYTLQVNGDISGNRLCIGNDCRSSWPSGGTGAITGSGSSGQVAFWTTANNLSGSNNLLWDNDDSTLRVNGNVQVNGNVAAYNFLGRINASNVSAGTFGANTGGGNYSFPGNVGIGTTAPTTKLDVNGGALFSSTAGGTTGHVKILSSPSVAGKGGLLLTQVADYTAGTGAFKLYTTNTGGLSGNLFIAHVDQGTPDAVTNLVTIRAGGNVGIGTTAPTQRLDVIGFVRGSQGLCIGNDCRTSWPEGGTSSGYWVANGANIYNTNTGNVGIGTTEPGAKLNIKTNDITTVPFKVDALVVGSTGWNYRMPITINNTSSYSQNLTDYQVLVTLDTASLINAGKMRSNCGDIRFTDSDGRTLLSYWIESDWSGYGCNKTYTKIWVKVPSISANSTKKIYVYYGNPYAISKSDGKKTFYIFEDWEKGTIDTNYWLLSGNATVSPPWITYIGRGYEGSYSAGNNDIDAYQYVTIFKTVNFPMTWRIDFHWKVSSESDLDYLEFYIDSTKKSSIYRSAYFQPQSYTDNPGEHTVGWEYHKNSYVDSIGLIDYIRARGYVNPEPTITVGAEELMQQQQQTVFYIQNWTGNIGIGTTNPGYKLDVDGDVRATGFYTSSDIRFKQNILPLNSSGSVLEKLNNLRGVYFEWNDIYKNSKRKDNKRHIGLIAQEVEKEFPELVFRGNDGSDYLSVDYSRFTAVLLEGLKELNQKLEEFKNKIENSILKVKELIADFIQVKKIRVDKIEMIDQKTGEIYCAWFENGELQKSKGECK